MKKLLILSFILLCSFMSAIAFNVVIHEQVKTKRPDFSWQVVYRTEKSIETDIIEAETIEGAIQINQKLHPDTEILSLNRRSFVYCVIESK